MKLKSHILFWSFAVFVGALIYYFPQGTFWAVMVVGVIVYVGRIILARREKSKPEEPKKKERVCCPRCSGEEPWPGDSR